MILKGSKNNICDVPQINFGHLIFRETEGADCEVLSFEDTSYEQFCEYKLKLKNFGFAEADSHNMGINTFCLFLKDNSSLLLSYYPNVSQMRIVAQCGSLSLNFFDNKYEKTTTSKLTMIDLEDFGESLVLRLNDGRFIVFDGGWPFSADADKLMKVLSEQ